mgnify:CR=1 FL=1
MDYAFQLQKKKQKQYYHGNRVTTISEKNKRKICRFNNDNNNKFIYFTLFFQSYILKSIKSQNSIVCFKYHYHRESFELRAQLSWQ